MNNGELAASARFLYKSTGLLMRRMINSMFPEFSFQMRVVCMNIPFFADQGRVVPAVARLNIRIFVVARGGLGEPQLTRRCRLLCRM